MLGAAAQLSVDNNAYRGARPALYNNAALNLGGLSCQYYPACQASLFFDVQESQRRADPNKTARPLPGDTLGQPSFNDCAHSAIIQAQGSGLATNFSWTVDGQPKASPPNNPSVIQLVLKAGFTYDVQVTVTSLCDGSLLTAQQQLQGTFPNCRVAASPVAMYPNPATDGLDFAPADDGPATCDYTVGLYDGQGTLRWQGRAAAGKLHVDCAELPRGIYGVVITQGDTVARRNLSLE